MIVKTRGFTLIELLVVIAIISLLTSVMITSLSTVRAKARDSVRIKDFQQFQNALELYYDLYGRYPCGDSNDGHSSGNPSGTLDSSGSDGYINHTHGLNVTNCAQQVNDPPFGLYPVFYPKFYPKDPINDWSTLQIYWYYVSTDRQSYVISVRLEVNPGLMENDEGVCPTRYEKWGGRVRITQACL